jgi:hypothetical protein
MGLLRILYLAMVLCMTHPVSSKAQKDASEPLYRRSSLCQIMICHSDQEYSSAIKSVYLKLPVSEHYNDHNLSVKVVETVGKLSKSGRNTENEGQRRKHGRFPLATTRGKRYPLLLSGMPKPI